MITQWGNHTEKRAALRCGVRSKGLIPGPSGASCYGALAAIRVLDAEGGMSQIRGHIARRTCLSPPEVLNWSVGQD